MSRRLAKEYSASIIAVGTELTSGELINSNAAWLSEKLEDLGLEVELHMTVPDDRSLILEALGIASSHSPYIFVTGGLGPTKDDFTRELVAEWSDLPLEKNEKTLQELKERFAQMGRAFHDFQEQQCYFPSGAEIIKNEAGTANAFYLQKDSKHLWTLPGPPREIEAVWSEISKKLVSLVKKKKALVLRSWLCFGEGESTLAKITEEALQGLPFRTGYRAHAPYVEIKTWGTVEDYKKHDDLSVLTRLLKSFLVSRKKQTYSRKFLEQVVAGESEGCQVIDGVSRGALAESLLKNLKESRVDGDQLMLSSLLTKEGYDQEKVEVFLEKNKEVLPLYFILPSENSGEYWVGLQTEQEITLQRLSYTNKRKMSQRLMSLWAVEKACALWLSLSISS